MGSAALVATHQTVLLTGPGSRASSQLFPTISAAPEATVGAWRPIPIGDEDNALVVGAGNDGPSVLPDRGVRQASRWPQSQSAGWYLCSRRHILLQPRSRRHVVNGCDAVSVGRPGSLMQPATVIARDTKNDLALLSSQLKPERVATTRTNVRLGENIAVYGFPLAGILPSTGNFTLGNIDYFLTAPELKSATSECHPVIRQLLQQIPGRSRRMQGDHIGRRLWLSKLGIQLRLLRFERQQLVTNSCSGG